MKRVKVLGVAALVAAAGGAVWAWRAAPRAAEPPPSTPAAGATSLPQLVSVGPRYVSNETSAPLAVYGRGLVAGLTLNVGPPLSRALPLTVVDERHAYARLPELPLAPGAAEAVLELSLSRGQGTARLRVVNDLGFPDLSGLVLARGGKLAFTVSRTTDQLYEISLETGAVRSRQVGDGPSALGLFEEPGGREWVVIAHAWAPELWLLPAEDLLAQPRRLPAVPRVRALLVERAVAFVAEQARDSVSAISLPDGRELWRTPVAPNPGALARLGDALAVGSHQTGEVELLDVRTGGPRAAISPTQQTAIIGGKTAPYAAYIVGGKAVRALAAVEKESKLLVSSIGPNIGPNPDKVEVSMNGGVGVVDAAAGRFVQHLGFGAGVTGPLLVDEARGVAFAADPALGRVRVLQLRRLLSAAPAESVLQELPIVPPEGFPTVRPVPDFSEKGRAGVELHSGPSALALSPDRTRLYVLDRFTGTLAVVDARRARAGGAKVLKQLKVVDTLGQRTRRLGQVLYFADLGRTAMSCDACHLEGHTEGIFFEKTHPMRLYRSPTVRGSLETPPYFTPASTRSLGETSLVVGGRNRFHNPDPTPEEVEALTVYSSGLPTLPNPFAGPNGEPPEALTLPDGRVGHPRRGAELFAQAGCEACHPPPLFTLDQDLATRGRYLKVGTPEALPLRLAQQQLVDKGAGTPSLLGSWDVFPMLTSGAAGLEVRPDETIGVAARYCLPTAISLHATPTTPPPGSPERADLEAFILSL